MHRLLQPKVEAELAFVLGADLDQDLGEAAIRRAVDHAVVALEIVDSRIAGWDIAFADTVADNASAGLFVLGEDRLTLDRFEPRDTEMVMRVDGTTVSTGDGRACLGDPLAALAWLARTAAELGDPLRAGQVVLSGALGPMADVRPGTTVVAELSVRDRPLGSVAALFPEVAA
jgi:2-keto-4-pentenoate hydratase